MGITTPAAVTTKAFVARYGHKPEGFGFWAFEVQTPATTIPMHGIGNYDKVLAKVRAKAAGKGATTIAAVPAFEFKRAGDSRQKDKR